MGVTVRSQSVDAQGSHDDVILAVGDEVRQQGMSGVLKHVIKVTMVKADEQKARARDG